MYLINSITDDALQNLSLTLPDGSVISMTIYYVTRQLGWFITSFTYGSFTVEGVRITNSPNMFRQFRNELQFGLACFSIDDREPTLQTDFSESNSQLYILTAAEVAQYEAYLNG